MTVEQIEVVSDNEELPTAVFGLESEEGLEDPREVPDDVIADFGDIVARATLALAEEEPAMVRKDVYTKRYKPETCEVEVESSVTIEDYERVTPPADMVRLREYAAAMEGNRLMFLNATYAGGGVAIMRAPLIHLLQSVGVDAHWNVMQPNDDAFLVTKHKFHNVLQDVAGPGVELNEDDKQVYESWIAQNAVALEGPLRDADVIVIDDWQPSGLIPYIKGDETHAGFNPNAPILFRDHIQTEGELMGTQGTPQHTTWQYIWDHNQVNRADVFITHPVPDFVPPEVPDKNVVYMPATCELLDDLNRPLAVEEVVAGMTFLNEQLAANENQTPIDMNRPYIVLIARFDPSKGMPLGMESYAKAREKMLKSGVDEADLPQLVVLGNGSIDDPDGVPVLADIMRRRSEDYGDIKDDMKVIRVPHYDAAINALLTGAALALQPSTKEGFEDRVTSAMLHGVPVIGSDRGGIPLQIVEGESGHVVDPYDTERWSNLIAGLMTNPEQYAAMRERTRELAIQRNYAFTTVPNALRWLSLSLMVKSPDFQGNRRLPEEISV